MAGVICVTRATYGYSVSNGTQNAEKCCRAAQMLFIRTTFTTSSLLSITPRTTNTNTWVGIQLKASIVGIGVVPLLSISVWLGFCRQIDKNEGNR